MSTSSFSNETIESSSLPKAREQQFLPLSPAYVKVNLLCRLLIWLVILVALVVVYWQPWFELPSPMQAAIPSLLIAIASLGLLLSVYGVIGDKIKGYALREHDLSYKSGVIFKSIISQPILRIQHVELKHGPIDRHFGLASLEVFSAGGAMHTFAIPGLPEEKARELRQYILEHGDIAANE